MKKCLLDRECKVPHCLASCRIIAHWKDCNSSECPVCLPVRDNKSNIQANVGTANASTMNVQSNVSALSDSSTQNQVKSIANFYQTFIFRGKSNFSSIHLILRMRLQLKTMTYGES